MYTIIGFILTLIFGLFVSLVVVPKMNSLERLGLSYILGLGIQTFLMFAAYLFGVNFTLESTLVILITTTSLLFPFVKKLIRPFVHGLITAIKVKNFNRVETTLLLIILFFILFSLACTLYWPVNSWDSLVLYDWRAKLFYLNGNMDDGIRRGYFFGVPLLTSLSHTWAYFLGAEKPEFIYTLFLASFISMFFNSLKVFTSRMISLFAVLPLVTSVDILGHSTFSYTNFPYTVYFVMSSIYLYIWMVKGKRGYLLLSGILLGLSTWTRSTEPFWIVNLVVLVIYSLYKRKLLQPVVFAVPLFLIRQPWVFFENSKLDYSTTVTSVVARGIVSIFSQLSLDHIILVASFLYQNVFVGLTVYLFAFLFLLIWSIKICLKNRDLWLSGMIIGYFLLIVVGTYMLSFLFRDWKIGGSAARMVMFIPPLIIFYIASSKKIGNLFGVKYEHEKEI